MPPFCQQCEQRPAVVFITQVNDAATSKTRLCEECAREWAFSESWLTQLIDQWGDQANWPPELLQALRDAPLEQIMLELFENGFTEADEVPLPCPMTDSFDDEFDFDAPDAFNGDLNDDFDGDFDDGFETKIGLESLPMAASGPSGRCPNCHTTWDRIRDDGRAGCAACYDSFRAEVGEVMARVQRGAAHVGKVPRAARKRLKRVEHLQTRREHQLELLQNRLKEAVASEKYEDAAKLRDKIRGI